MSSGVDQQSPKKGQITGGGLRVALWLAGSALFGSVALVLWNRKALRTLHEAVAHSVEPVRMRDDEGIY